MELTEAGRRVLRFCRASSSLEEEILSDLTPDPCGPLKGVIRIAAHSSILQPVLMLALAPLLRENPFVQCELIKSDPRQLGFHNALWTREMIRDLKPSDRGELEISDVNNMYIERGQLEWSELEGWWTDAGTFPSLLHASQLVAETGANKTT